MNTVAVAIVCKTPLVGQSKTRLSPPLGPRECAALSACFIQDIARTVAAVAADGDIQGYALYTPLGSEAALQNLLPEDFRLIAQSDGDLETRLVKGIDELLARGHAGAVLVNADSPTLPGSILRAAVAALRRQDNVVLGPAHDGGYTLIGLSRPHPRLFADIPWSTGAVHALTMERARETGLPVVNVAAWYDVDDAAALGMLEAELGGEPPPFAAPGVAGAEAPATRRFLRARRAAHAGIRET